MNPTQVDFPWKATLRTAVQVVVSLAVVVPAILAALDSSGLSQYLGSLWPRLVGAGAFLVALSAALARVMAIPQVNEWLKAVGLGAEPKPPQESNPLTSVIPTGGGQTQG